jgi:hypothetical protein
VQDVGLQNIRSVVTIVLEHSLPNYKQWRDLMLLTLCYYALNDHILFDVADPSIYWGPGSSAPSPPSSTRSFGSRWRPHVTFSLRSRLSSSPTTSHVFYNSMPGSVPSSKETSALATTIVVTWIFGTLCPELHEIVRESMETAHHFWLAIEAQFLSNNESRVLQLDARFRTFKQGDLNVSDYYHRMKGMYYRWMKGMADDLRALGETVTNRHLILNLLQDLNKRFDHMKIFIKQSRPLPLLPHRPQ